MYHHLPDFLRTSTVGVVCMSKMCSFLLCGRFNCQSIKCSISTALFLYKFSTVLCIHNKFLYFCTNFLLYCVYTINFLYTIFSFSYIHNKEILLKSFTHTNIAFTLFFFFLILLAVSRPGGDVRLQFWGQCKRHPLHFSVISLEIGSISCGIFLIIFPSKEIKDFTVAKLL